MSIIDTGVGVFGTTLLASVDVGEILSGFGG